MFTCDHCGTETSSKQNLKRHLRTCKELTEKSDEESPKCEYCGRKFARLDNLKRHIRNCQKKSGNKRPGTTEDDTELPMKKNKWCELCEMDMNNEHAHVRSDSHRTKAITRLKKDTNDNNNIEIINCAFKSRIVTYRVSNSTTSLTANDFMCEMKGLIIRLIADKQAELNSAVKVNLVLYANYKKTASKAEENEMPVEDIKRFNTRNITIFQDAHTCNIMEDTYKTFSDIISKKSDEFEERGSGWAINKVLYLDININLYDPIKGTSDLGKSKSIKSRKAYQANNKDSSCFFKAVRSALNAVTKNPTRPPLKTYGISIPVDIEDIAKFEEMNGLSINVYEIKKPRKIGLTYCTKKVRDLHINLLLTEVDGKTRYCFLKNMSRLLASQLGNGKRKVWICNQCQQKFIKEQQLSEHIKDGCSTPIILPLKQETLKFKNYKHKLRVPVVVYADFECVLKPIASCAPDASSSYTYAYQLHEPYSFGYFIKCNYNDSLSKYVSFRGAHCEKKFLESLEIELTPFAKTITTVVPMHKLTSEQQLEYRSAITCHICGKELGTDKVCDHCHLTGDYRGAAHESCNLNYKMKHVIPVIIHNLSKYDLHLFIRSFEARNLKVLAKNKENFISITSKNHFGLKFKLRFIDSYRFLASSLDKLASNLDSNKFVNTHKHFSEHTELLTKKGVFPYDYITSVDKLEETSLPPHNEFYNHLNNSNISSEQYEHAQIVWKALNVKTLGEYSDIYIKTDVLLLTDVFESFRDICHNTYQLDPAHYFTAPGLAWDAMLQYTKIEMTLLSDLSMVRFITNGIRGGLSQCCGRYAKANNKYISDYDPDKPSNFIVYLDANNQYGWAMSQYLPFGDFSWLSESEIADFDVRQIADDAATGYILEVDLDYPEDLHDLHNDLCFCPERRLPDVSGAKCQKLLSNLYPKFNYAIHYVNLKQAIKHRLVFKKIHRVLSFSQSPWLKCYIDKNTNMRATAKNAFEEDFYKFMNNSVYGKSMENVEKRVHVEIVSNWESVGKKLGARAYLSKPNFDSYTILNEDLCVIQMKLDEITYDKPIYLGFTVLELSKTLMYDFHYNYTLPKYGEKATLLYTDTDSFIYNIETVDFYADVKPDLEKWFDTSSFPSDNIYNLPLVNKKVVGMFKDNYNGEIIREFIGIRSKCYFIKKDNQKEIKKIKGVKKNVVKNEISGEDYLSCVRGETENLYRSMNVIRSQAHTLYTQKVNKIVLNNADDKRFTIPDNSFKTLAWGHFAIQSYRRQ